MSQYIYGLLVAALLACVGLGYGWKHSHDSLVTYRAEVAQAGRDQAAAVKLKEADDKLKKEKYDAQLKNLQSRNTDLSMQLLNSRSSSGYLPKASASASHPERACFDRLQLESAIRQLDSGVQGIITEGDNFRVGLDTAKVWAQNR